MTGYMLFSLEKRPELAKEHPDETFGQLGKLLGQAWKGASESEKEKFNAQAAKEKLRYQKEMAEYRAKHPESSDDEAEKKTSKTKRKKKKKDPDAPKKHVSAFLHFSSAVRPKIKTENPDAKFGEIGKLIGQAWASIDPKDKATYDELAQKDRERYEAAMKNYKPKTAAPAKKKPKKKKESSSSESEVSDSSDSDSSSSSDSDGSD